VTIQPLGVILRCDGCEAEYTQEAFETAKEARANARRDGWHTNTARGDICDECWAENH
jgi:hypothetical protein